MPAEFRIRNAAGQWLRGWSVSRKLVFTDDKATAHRCQSKESAEALVTNEPFVGCEVVEEQSE